MRINKKAVHEALAAQIRFMRADAQAKAKFRERNQFRNQFNNLRFWLYNEDMKKIGVRFVNIQTNIGGCYVS